MQKRGVVIPCLDRSFLDSDILPCRLGATRPQLAADAVRTHEAQERARKEVEAIEELAQVSGYSHNFYSGADPRGSF